MDQDTTGPQQRAGRLQDLPQDRGVAVEIGEQTILLVRDGDAVHAYAGKCPHAGAPLAEGAVCDGRIVCPWHKSAFRVADGAVVEPPGLIGLDRFPVRIDASGDVFVSAEKSPPAAAPGSADAGTMLVLGAGAAGAAAVAALREFGHGGEIVLIGGEAGDPYDRTSLSKFVMSGDMPPGEVPPLLPEHFLAQHRVSRIEAEIVALDPAAREVRLGDGRVVRYDAALVATGGVPTRPSLPGTDLAGVHTLRCRADAAAITAGLHAGARVVILGGSFIALEVASGLRARKLPVAVVAPEPVPFVKQFGPQLGQMLKTLHEANGTVFHAERHAKRIEGDARAERVVLDDGTVLPADLVIIGTGVRPATGFVRGLDLVEDGGIPVDAGMRAADGLYAAGDVARFPLPGEADRVRIEHWRVAQQHARIAARNMLGGNERYQGVPFFWTYHFGQRFEYLGHATAWDDVVIEGTLPAYRFVAFLVTAGNVAGVLACQRERATAILINRMRSALPLDEARRIVLGT